MGVGRRGRNRHSIHALSLADRRCECLDGGSSSLVCFREQPGGQHGRASQRGGRVAEMTQNTGASIFLAISRARAQQTLENTLNLVVLPLKWLAGPWN